MIQSKIPDMIGSGKQIRNLRWNPPGEILLQQELHAWTAMR